MENINDENDFRSIDVERRLESFLERQVDD